MSFVWPTSQLGMPHPLSAVSAARTQGIAFLQMAEAAQNGWSYGVAKMLFPGVDSATVETRKSLYEELGLLYVPRNSDTLHLTSIGRQIFELLGTTPPEEPSADLRKRVDSLLCWAMTHTQINRPQSFGSPSPEPEDRAKCDIRPYATFWQAMLELGGFISFDEFSHVLAHIQSVSEFPSAVQKILEARESGVLPDAPNKSGNFGIYWRSHLSVASEVLQICGWGFSPLRPSVRTSSSPFWNSRWDVKAMVSALLFSQNHGATSTTTTQSLEKSVRRS